MDSIQKISIEDENYPELLKKIANHPKVLFYKGEIKPKELCFGIVGTRLCSSYGKQVALEMAGKLCELGITIVSGMAPGIDSYSHLAAVENNKRTIAVLGTGLDEKSIYPKENIGLSRKILETGGCLVSEYPPGTSATQFTFPQRNRIISGLAVGILVVEAKEKSGSLITANCAFSQKRKVFAVPGPIYSPNSKGTNYLIKRGAKLVDNVDDILQELDLNIKAKAKNGITGDNPEENLILQALGEGPLYIDKIIEKTKLSVAIAASTISVLEIKEKIRNLGGNVYALSR
jgi:DNA processing protein